MLKILSGTNVVGLELLNRMSGLDARDLAVDPLVLCFYFAHPLLAHENIEGLRTLLLQMAVDARRVA
eukprot:XP_001709612.1 Hypothetical protein GL50803_38186 [Giardia lamblia ATCC 50803]